MIKRFTINLLIIFMAFMGVIYGYTQSFSLSKFDRFSYAEADNWSSCDSSDLVTAFRYYCKSRNLAIEGSVADALTSFTTTTFNNICSTLGIDTTQLQAELKKTTNGNLGLRFLFSQTGITAYNRIFSEFLQNNNLSVGDEVENLVLKSAEWFSDVDGNGCYVTVIQDRISSFSFQTEYSTAIQKLGTAYILTAGDCYNLTASGNYSGTVHLTDNQSVVYTLRRTSDYVEMSNNVTSYKGYARAASNNGNFFNDSGLAILKWDNKYYFGCVCYTGNWNAVNTRYNVYGVKAVQINNGNVKNGNVYITTNNTTINNNNYNNSYTIIYNDGDHYGTDDDEPGPDTPPGGGGGDDPGGDPDATPSGPDLPDWQPPSGTGTIGSDGNFDFDLPFSLPNLNIDWSLKDIGHKFPFCIPGDIVSFYQTLAVEPRAPAIDAHIPLGSFYDWHFVADFSQYNTWAVIIRAVEYVGFVIGLIYFTVRLVKG